MTLEDQSTNERVVDNSEVEGGGTPSKSDIQKAKPNIKKKLENDAKTQQVVKFAEQVGIETKEITKKLSEIDTSVDTTKKNLPSKFQAIQEKIQKGETLSLLSDIGALLGYLINVLFNGGKDSEGKIIEGALDIKKLDFTSYSLAQLGGNIAKQDFPELPKNDAETGKLQEPKRGEKSLIGKLIKKANSGDLSDQVMYTAALSKAKDTFYAKYKKRADAGKDKNNINPDLTEAEIKQLNSGSSYEQIAQNIQPGDMVFFIAGDTANQKWYNSALSLASSLPIYHVGLVGEGGSFYHSTMKDQGTGYAGAHKVNFKDELNSRKPCKVLVVRPNTDTGKMLTSAQHMVDSKVKYSKMDAMTSFARFGNVDGKDKMNCGDFVNATLQASGVMGIKNAGVPANILETGKEKNLGFTNQYLGDFSGGK